MSKMTCKICAGEIPYEDGVQIVQCPYCGSKMSVAEDSFDEAKYSKDMNDYARQNQEADAFLRDLEEKAQRAREESVGELKLVVKRGKSMWSLADGSTYWFIIDNKLDVRVPAMKDDISATVQLPAGSHMVYLQIFAWDDKDCNNVVESLNAIPVYVPKGGVCTVEANRPGMFGKYTMTVV